MRFSEIVSYDLLENGYNKFKNKEVVSKKIHSEYEKNKKIILISGAIAFALLGLEIVLYVIDENEYEQEIISECKTWWKSDTNVEVCLVEGNEHVENCPKIESDDYGKKYCILGEKTYQEFLEP